MIGAEEYTEKCICDTVEKWVSVAFSPKSRRLNLKQHTGTNTGCYKRTMLEMEDYLQPFEQVIRHHLIPVITCGHFVSDRKRSLLALPTRLGGLELKNFVDTASHEYENS